MGAVDNEIKKTVKKSVVKKIFQGSNAKLAITTEMIAKKAYELYEKRGRQQGHELQDWQEAKKILEAGE